MIYTHLYSLGDQCGANFELAILLTNGQHGNIPAPYIHVHVQLAHDGAHVLIVVRRKEAELWPVIDKIAIRVYRVGLG